MDCGGASTPVNDAGRLYQQQLDARLAFENGTGSPADDQRRLDGDIHWLTRFVAFDIDATLPVSRLLPHRTRSTILV